MKKCAAWCGRGCTKEEYDQAVHTAKKIVEHLGTGWEPHVSENLGWHARAVSSSGVVKVHTSSGGRYLAFFGEPRFPGGDWSAHGDTPKGAVSAVVTKAVARRDELTEWLEEFE